MGGALTLADGNTTHIGAAQGNLRVYREEKVTHFKRQVLVAGAKWAFTFHSKRVSPWIMAS
jgi:hypothetical protein